MFFFNDLKKFISFSFFFFYQSILFDASWEIYINEMWLEREIVRVMRYVKTDYLCTYNVRVK